MVTQLPLLCFSCLSFVVFYSILINLFERRNKEVRDYYMELSTKVIVASFNDAFQERSSKWRTDKLAEMMADYNRMVYSFWRPVDSFYPDQRFLDPQQAEDPTLDDMF